ncbi:hypothetical protein DL93DRAFT_2091630 [Clavulina sp. PMI_390]|nr:hypothetical protein DL93DRAFT_2091630 [Clavulina sp. PMI_390]
MSQNEVQDLRGVLESLTTLSPDGRPLHSCLKGIELNLSGTLKKAVKKFNVLQKALDRMTELLPDVQIHASYTDKGVAKKFHRLRLVHDNEPIGGLFSEDWPFPWSLCEVLAAASGSSYYY